jgi:glutaredoxin
MIIIYGKENCPQCNLAKLACDIRSVPYEYKLIGVDATPDELTLLAGVPIRSAPVIFERADSGEMQYVGGYKELRQWLKHNHPRNSR